MRPYMTFEVKVQLIKDLCLYNVIIHTKFGYYQILEEKNI